MSQTFNIPNTPLPVGDTVFGPFTVNAGVSSIELHFPPRLQPNSGGAVLSQLWIAISLDGGVTWQERWAGTGFWGDPTFTDSKTGGTDAVTKFNPFPSPSLVRLTAATLTAFTLTGASIVVS